MASREDCIFLNPFYIETRYPVYWPVHYTKEVARQAKDVAEDIGRFVRQKISG